MASNSRFHKLLVDKVPNRYFTTNEVYQLYNANGHDICPKLPYQWVRAKRIKAKVNPAATGTRSLIAIHASEIMTDNPDDPMLDPKYCEQQFRYFKHRRIEPITKD